jgi:hypothetical protein
MQVMEASRPDNCDGILPQDEVRRRELVVQAVRHRLVVFEGWAESGRHLMQILVDIGIGV